MATVTSKATGNWSAGSTWDSDPAIPGGTDDVVIATGHTVTKDTAKGAPDCALVTVNGTLAVGSNGLKCTRITAGTGTVTGGPDGEIESASWSNILSVRFNLAGTSGHPFLLTGPGSGYMQLAGSSHSSPPSASQSFVWCRFQNWSQSIYLNGWTVADLFTDCDFDNTGADQGLFTYTASTGLRCVRCHFYGSTVGAKLYTGSVGVFEGCVFGEQRDGTPDANTTDLIIGNAATDRAVAYCHNCLFASTNEITINAVNVSAVYCGGYDQEEGGWRIVRYTGKVFRSTASKKTGDYGNEMVPTAGCLPTNHLWIDLPIPVNTGDTVAPSIYYQNVTADLDLEAAAGRLVFELDPGDEWGLNETIDVNGLSDSYNNWRQITFTGGTAGGSGDKGTVLLRVTLARYVATGVVYLADPDNGVS